MLKPKRGEIWLVRFPFTDLVSTKLRPALVWATHGTDIIVSEKSLIAFVKTKQVATIPGLLNNDLHCHPR